jgi:hypothetical protein
VRREWWSLQEARARIYRGFEAQSRRRKRWTEGNATRTSRQSQRSRRSYRTMVTMWMRSDAPRRGSRRIGPWGRLAPCSHIESSDEASTYEAALGTVLRWHWTFELSYMCTSSLPSLIASASPHVPAQGFRLSSSRASGTCRSSSPAAAHSSFASPSCASAECSRAPVRNDSGITLVYLRGYRGIEVLDRSPRLQEASSAPGEWFDSAGLTSSSISSGQTALDRQCRQQVRGIALLHGRASSGACLPAADACRRS